MSLLSAALEASQAAAALGLSLGRVARQGQRAATAIPAARALGGGVLHDPRDRIFTASAHDPRLSIFQAGPHDPRERIFTHGRDDPRETIFTHGPNDPRDRIFTHSRTDPRERIFTADLHDPRLTVAGLNDPRFTFLRAFGRGRA